MDLPDGVQPILTEIEQAIGREKAATITANNHFERYSKADNERMEAPAEIKELNGRLNDLLGREQVPGQMPDAFAETEAPQ